MCLFDEEPFTSKSFSYVVETDADNIILTPKYYDGTRPIPSYRISGCVIDSIICSAKHKGVHLTQTDIIRAIARTPTDQWVYDDIARKLIAERLQIKLPLPTTPELVKWLAGGERGDSSNVVFAHMTGVKEATAKQCDKTFAPMDADDMSRCLKLIDIGGQTWRDAIPSLATLSPEWEKIVARWDRLEAFTRQCMKGDTPPMHWHWKTWREIIKQNP